MATRRTDGFIDPCMPTLAAKAPSGPGWVHEIKHDGYRLIVRRDGDTVRLCRALHSDTPPVVNANASEQTAISRCNDRL